MCNLDQLGLIKPFAEVTGYGENDVHHKIEDRPWVANSYVTLDVSESHEHHQNGGAT